MSYVDDWVKSHPIEAMRLTARTHVTGKTRPQADDDETITKKEAGMETPPTTATDTLMRRITKRQQDAPALSFQDASTQVLREDPDLYQEYLDEQRQHQPRQRPVEKRDASTREAIEKMVEAQVFQRPTLTRMDAWQEVLKSHEGQADFGAIYEAYRRYQISAEALRDHDAAQARR
jgi:hypothetical protein